MQEVKQYLQKLFKSIKKPMAVEQNILLTVDALILASKGGQEHLLLIERKNDPFKGFWAFPGGFVEDDEDLEPAARRELEEETGILMDELTQFKAVGTPGRDPRGRTVTIIFFGAIDSHKMDTAKGGDDAAKAKWFPINNLPELAFDHEQIINDFKEYLIR
jgi:8-oxo-dGTP diphosphatase